MRQYVVLTEGTVAIQVDGEVVGTVGRGHGFWWPEVLVGAPAAATAVTLGPCQVLVATRAECAAVAAGHGVDAEQLRSARRPAWRTPAPAAKGRGAVTPAR